MKTNTSGRSGENPTSWRHFIACDVISQYSLSRKITSRAVKWRHNVGHSPNFQEMFLIIISRCVVNIMTFAQFKQKLQIFFINFRIKYIYFHRKTKLVLNFRLKVSNDLKFIPQLKTMKINIYQTFGRNLAKIDIVTSYFVPAVQMGGVSNRNFGGAMRAHARLNFEIIIIKIIIR